MVCCQVTCCTTFLSTSFVPLRYRYLENSHNNNNSEYSARTLSPYHKHWKTIQKLNSKFTISILLYCSECQFQFYKACTCQSYNLFQVKFFTGLSIYNYTQFTSTTCMIYNVYECIVLRTQHDSISLNGDFARHDL